MAQGDSALRLRMQRDSGRRINSHDALQMLSRSALVKKLTCEFEPHGTYAVWRLLALSEIPFTAQLAYTKKVLGFIEKNMSTDVGFSLFGGVDDLLPCYNSMLIEGYSKLGLTNHPTVKNGVEWILDYQPINRETLSSWDKPGVRKYGGCFHATACYIGVAKAIKAIQAYQKFSGPRRDDRIEAFLQKGIDYLLQHRLYLRLGIDKPIMKDILCLSFPANYKLNILELLEIMSIAGKIDDEACKSAMDQVLKRRSADGYWKVDYNYRGKGYVSFDNKRGMGEWVTYLIRQIIPNK